MLFTDEDFVNIVPQDLLERGINLREKLGFYEIAWKFDDAIEVIKIAKDKGMIILGGDVYRLNGNEPVITCNSWYTNEGNDNAFEVAIQYITNYRARNGDDFIYYPAIGPGRVSK